MTEWFKEWWIVVLAVLVIVAMLVSLIVGVVCAPTLQIVYTEQLVCTGDPEHKHSFGNVERTWHTPYNVSHIFACPCGAVKYVIKENKEVEKR